jgi:hypothetical protein
MAKQRGSLNPTRTKSTTGATPIRKTTGPQKVDATKKLRASPLLMAAKNRDLIDEELKILSVVQLAEYARIRHNPRTVGRALNTSGKTENESEK